MSTTQTQVTNISAATMIPALLQAMPNLRSVLDRYGLRGCGGEHGPMESLAFFSRAHDVPLEELLGELYKAARAGHKEGVAPSDPIADAIFQPFFKAGIAVVLSLGAVWGAYLLIRIAILKSFTAVGINEVNAHGHAQIFGWVGLFVMGFAYQAFPRFKHTSLAHPRLAMSTLWMMLLGIVMRSGAQAFLSESPSLAVVGMAGSAFGIAAIVIFSLIILNTLLGSGRRLAFYDYYILCAIGWFAVQAVYDAIYFGALAYAPTGERVLQLVSTWQGPLRDLQIHGFAMLMILGVSQRAFPNFYGLRAPNPVRSLVALVLLNAAIVGEVAGFVLMRTAGHAYAALWYGSVVAMAVTLAFLISGWDLYSRSKESDRSLKFLRVADAWLFLSMTMSALLPLYQFGLLRTFAPHSQAALMGFSHAYYGAIRHAITVGFISFMIVGVASKVVPTLKGVDVRGLSGLWIPFFLLNFGCAMRVGFQSLTDFQDIAFPMAGISGILEVTALAIWGAHVLGIMSGRVTSRCELRDATPLEKGAPIEGENSVGDVLDTYPALLPVFLQFGFAPLSNPVLRKALAKRVTVDGAARRMGIDAEIFKSALNAARVSSWGN